MDQNLCPKCGSKMVSRLNKSTQQRFWGCSDFPNCKGTRNTDGESPEEAKERQSSEDLDITKRKRYRDFNR